MEMRRPAAAVDTGGREPHGTPAVRRPEAGIDASSSSRPPRGVDATAPRRYWDLRRVGTAGVEACQNTPEEAQAQHHTKSNSVTHNCRVLQFERDQPGVVNRLLEAWAALEPSEVSRYTPGCGVKKPLKKAVEPDAPEAPNPFLLPPVLH